ncbi:MAG TPA: winged helix-turn-helix domain-containing protein [Candidatus Acidoferrales bacterium]|nr:winged helix-turn-helix domain-containing protein [Candidatus Acidoferrales bacterium]
MSSPAESRRKIRFGDFEIDMRTAEVRQNGHKFVLQGQPFQVLAFLLEKPGELVTREELKKRLWSADTFVDFDHSLNKAVNRLRETLADSADKPSYIETLPRRGYRFIAPVTSDDQERLLGEPALAGRGSPAMPVSACSAQLPVHARWERFAKPVISAELLFLIAISVVTWHRFSRSHPVSLETLEMNTLTEVGTAKNVAISQDGRYVVYAVDLGEKQGLRLRQVATRSDVELLPADAGNFVGLAFSPDGNYVYFVRSDRNDISFRYLYRIPSLGGAPRKLITDVDSGISFSPDGRKIAYEHWNRNDVELKIANPDGTGQQLLTVIHNANFLSPGDPGPTWSPDGHTITFSKLLVGKPRRWVLFAVSVANGRFRELYSDGGAIGRPRWLPTGDTLLVPHFDENAHRSQLWTVSFPSGTARRLTHDISDYSMDLDLTRDGATAGTITNVVKSEVWVSSSNSENLQQVTHGNSHAFQLKTNAADGKVLTTDWDGGLRMMNEDGTQESSLGSARGVSWFTLCGRTVVLTSNEGNSTTLLRLDADGTRVTKLANGNLWSPACSPDNHFVYYVNWEQPEKIWRMSLEGGAAVEVAQVLGDSIMGNITASPDGKYIAYPYSAYTGTTPGRHLAIIPAEGGTPVAQFDLPGSSWNAGPYWSADGSTLQYLRILDGVSNIWEQPLDGGAPRQLTHFRSGEIFDFAWSTDRKRLFMTRGNATSDVVLVSGFH